MDLLVNFPLKEKAKMEDNSGLAYALSKNFAKNSRTLRLITLDLISKLFEVMHFKRVEDMPATAGEAFKSEKDKETIELYY